MPSVVSAFVLLAGGHLLSALVLAVELLWWRLVTGGGAGRSRHPAPDLRWLPYTGVTLSLRPADSSESTSKRHSLPITARLDIA